MMPYVAGDEPLFASKTKEIMMADDGERLGLATEVTVAWLSNPHTHAHAEDVAAMLGSVFTALGGLNAPSDESSAASAPAPYYKPAVSVRRSLRSPDRIISMIDGKPYSSLRRHLRDHDLTPDQYRQRYGLKHDYPIVAPGYSADRSAAAKRHNFGRTATAAPTEPTAIDQPAPAKRRKLGIASAKQAAQEHLGGNNPVSETAPAES